MPERIVIHAGFHKTGTSSVQQLLRANRTLLKPHVALRLRWHMRDVVQATCAYSVRRDDAALARALVAFAGLLLDVPRMPGRTLILSAEELCGHLPGRDGIARYDAAPEMLNGFVTSAQAAFPKAEVLVYLSTRAPAAWLRSAYAEHVKSSAMTLDYQTFAHRFAGAADLEAIVRDIADRVPCPVISRRLEDCAGLPLGPAELLIDLCGLPAGLRACILAQPVENAQPPDAVLLALLDANRAYANRGDLRAAKAAILANTREQ